MAICVYSYPVASFANGVIESKLQGEINTSAAVTIYCSDVRLSGSSYEIVFQAQLSPAEKEALDGSSEQPPNLPPAVSSLLGLHDGSYQEESGELVRLDRNTKQVVELNEVENGDKYYRQFSFPLLELAAESTEGYTDLMVPFDFWFLSIEFFAGPGSNAKLGDSISALVSPVLPVDLAMASVGLPVEMGRTYAPIEQNACVCSLHPYTMANEDLIESFFRLGTILQFEDPAVPGQPHQSEYVIVKIDRQLGTVSLAVFDKTVHTFSTTNVVQEAYPAGSKIWRTIVAGDSINVLPTCDGNQYGQSKVGSSKLPGGTVFRVVYRKKAGDTETRTIAVNIEGMVGDRVVP